MSNVQIEMLSGDVRVFKDAVVGRVEPWIMVTRDAEVLGSFRESLVAMWGPVAEAIEPTEQFGGLEDRLHRVENLIQSLSVRHDERLDANTRSLAHHNHRLDIHTQCLFEAREAHQKLAEIVAKLDDWSKVMPPVITTHQNRISDLTDRVITLEACSDNYDPRLEGRVNSLEERLAGLSDNLRTGEMLDTVRRLEALERALPTFRGELDLRCDAIAEAVVNLGDVTDKRINHINADLIVARQERMNLAKRIEQVNSQVTDHAVQLTELADSLTRPIATAPQQPVDLNGRYPAGLVVHELEGVIDRALGYNWSTDPDGLHVKLLTIVRKAYS